MLSTGKTARVLCPAGARAVRHSDRPWGFSISSISDQSTSRFPVVQSRSNGWQYKQYRRQQTVDAAAAEKPYTIERKMVGVHDYKMKDLQLILGQDLHSRENRQVALFLQELELFLAHVREHIKGKKLNHLQFSHTGNVRVWFNQIMGYVRENSGVSLGELLAQLMSSVPPEQVNAGGRTYSSLQVGKTAGMGKEALFVTLLRAREALCVLLDHCEVDKALTAVSRTEVGSLIETELKFELGVDSHAHVSLRRLPLLVDHKLYMIRRYLAHNQATVAGSGANTSKRRRTVGHDYITAALTQRVMDAMSRNRHYQGPISSFTPNRFWDGRSTSRSSASNEEDDEEVLDYQDRSSDDNDNDSANDNESEGSEEVDVESGNSSGEFDPDLFVDNPEALTSDRSW